MATKQNPLFCADQIPTWSFHFLVDEVDEITRTWYGTEHCYTYIPQIELKIIAFCGITSAKKDINE